MSYLHSLFENLVPNWWVVEMSPSLSAFPSNTYYPCESLTIAHELKKILDKAADPTWKIVITKEVPPELQSQLRGVIKDNGAEDWYDALLLQSREHDIHFAPGTSWRLAQRLGITHKDLKDKDKVLQALKDLMHSDGHEPDKHDVSEELKEIFPMHFVWFRREVNNSFGLTESHLPPIVWWVVQLSPNLAVWTDNYYTACRTEPIAIRLKEALERDELKVGGWKVSITHDVPPNVQREAKPIFTTLLRSGAEPPETYRHDYQLQIEPEGKWKLAQILGLEVKDVGNKGLILKAMIDIRSLEQYQIAKKCVQEMYPMHWAWFERQLQTHGWRASP